MPSDPSYPTLGRDLGNRLCGIFGLDPKTTATMTLTVDPSDVVKLTVQQWVSEAEAGEVGALLEERRYTIREVV
jgi:hypothetical protein